MRIPSPHGKNQCRGMVYPKASLSPKYGVVYVPGRFASRAFTENLNVVAWCIPHDPKCGVYLPGRFASLAHVENPNVVECPGLVCRRATRGSKYGVEYLAGRFAFLVPTGKLYCRRMVFPGATHDPKYGVVYLPG